jgi:hypothetical protein
MQTAVKKPRRSRKAAKNAGASFERSIADWLRARLNDDRIDRRVKNGRNDRGDIAGVRTIRGGRVVIEAKNYAGEYRVAPWLAEAEIEAGNDDAPVGVVVAKKRGTTDPAAQVVFMDLETFARLLEGGPDEVTF